MRNRHVCRHLEHRAFHQASGHKSFFIPQARKHYAPDLPVKLEHLLLDVRVNPVAKTVEGTATQRIRVIAPDQSRIRLDQIGLEITETKVGGKTAKFSIDGHALWIDLASALGRAAKEGETLEVSTRYRVSNPGRGLYFTGPDEHYPKKRHQVWSQGQDEDNRHWYPSFDYPNQKATSEVIATVPKGFTAVSNGALLKKEDTAEGTRFHYKLGTPHVNYLVALTVAEFEAWEDKGPNGLPVQYFVEPGRRADGVRAFSNTPKMIEAYARKTGVDYPYEKYSQVAVQDFIFGGMENTSATTQTDTTLHDERAHLDFSSDPLVSHELAHQWFGDLLTCRDWSHGWLNEGFATFMERVWIEEHTGKDGGAEEAKFYSNMDLKEYLADDSARYRRPIVCNTYIEPIDLFDTHLYQKGGLVLNLIRWVLGPEQFWKAINLYVTRHRGGSVETLDLIRAIEEATGRNLRRLFDEWIFGGGHPEFEISYTWHEDRPNQKMAELIVEQKQTGGKDSVTENGVTTHLFHLPGVIEATLEGGAVVRHRFELGEARERLFIALPSKPLMIRFDPDNAIPKTMKFPRPKEMLLYQLSNDPDCMGRIEAAKELVKLATGDRGVVEALGKALVQDKFWGSQASIAEALAEVRTDSARDALVAAIGVKHPKARRAVVNALSHFRDAKAAAALAKVAKSDASYFVEADAVAGFAQASLPVTPAPGPKDIDGVETTLIEALSRESYRELIRSGALRGLGLLPGLGRGECPRAMQALLEWTTRGKPEDARRAAILALGSVLRSAVPAERARILAVFDDLANENAFRIRVSLVAALGASETPEAIPILTKIRALDLDGRVRREAAMAIVTLEGSGTAPESLARMKESHDKLEEEVRKLRSMVEEMKSRGAGNG